MGVSAIVNEGKITNMESTLSKDQKSSNSTVDKDQFMTLLVAQMKYQDPLEPTSNTEYISQYATFSELEQMQNMSKSLELTRASELTGKVVVVSPTEDNGLTKDLEGQVDKVFYSNNKAYVEVNGMTFSANDVTQVMSDDYADAKRLVQAWGDEIDKLPNINELTTDYADAINTLYAAYEAFSDSTKALIAPDYETSMKQYKSRIDELVTAEEEYQKQLAEAATKAAEAALSGEGAGDTETTEAAETATGTEPSAEELAENAAANGAVDAE